MTDTAFRDGIKTAIIHYFNENNGSVDTAGLLWEYFKATIRSTCIGLKARVLQSLRSRLFQLEKTLQTLERTYKTNPRPQTLANIRTHLSEYAETADQEICYLSKHWAATAYGEGGRPRRSLATKIKGPRDIPQILTLATQDGTCHHDAQAILKCFVNIFAQLYGGRQSAPPSETDDYLNDIALAWLLPCQREFLAQPITEEEVGDTIHSLGNCRKRWHFRRVL